MQNCIQSALKSEFMTTGKSENKYNNIETFQ